jgi:hypothetical protein
MTGLDADWRTNWTWVRQGLIVPDRRTYGLVDPGSGRASPLAPFDSLEIPVNPLLSPDGGTLIAVRGRPTGFASEIWQRRLGAGAWGHVPSTFTGEPFLLRWDDSGIYASIYLIDSWRVEIWRATSLGAPFTPLLTGLRWCTGWPPSLSDDNKHLACTETTTTSDIWLVSGFDGGAP